MIIKYQANIEKAAIKSNIQRLLNQTYKLLPAREEGLEWEKPLETIIEEFAGMDNLLLNKHEILFSLLCKLEGLYTLKSENSFQLYRRIIFECIGLIGQLRDSYDVN